jgi:hypothetical protein
MSPVSTSPVVGNIEIPIAHAKKVAASMKTENS